MENVMNEVLVQILPLLESLEWVFIASYIGLCYGVQSLEKHVQLIFLARIKKRFKVALVGLAYSPIYYFSMGLEHDQIGALFASFLFTFCFHKLLVAVFIEHLNNMKPPTLPGVTQATKPISMLPILAALLRAKKGVAAKGNLPA